MIAPMSINPIEAAISLILIWGAIPATIPTWAKALLTIFFLLDSCSAIPVISFYYTELPVNNNNNEGDNNNGKDEDNSNQ